MLSNIERTNYVRPFQEYQAPREALSHTCNQWKAASCHGNLAWGLISMQADATAGYISTRWVVAQLPGYMYLKAHSTLGTHYEVYVV